MRGELRTGRVSSADAKKHTARVQFFEGRADDENEGFVSRDLPILFMGRGDYHLPEKDALAVCFIPDDVVGKGFVLGFIYSDSDAPPTDDGARRVVAGDDLRLGSFDAGDKVALAPATKGNFDDLKNHHQAVYTVITGPPISEPGNGAPSAFQAALAAAIAGSPYPTPAEVAAEKVSAK